MQRDPTAVVGRRIIAAIVDGLLHFAANAIIFFLLAKRVTGVGQGAAVFGRLTVNDRGWEVTGGRSGLYYLLSFGLLFLHYGWLQGTRGYTLGKHAARVRVIGPDGHVPGIGRSVLRTIIWIVDAAPWCIPGLVGFILVLSTQGHRRIGDMAADTYVVTEEYVHAPQPQS